MSARRWIRADLARRASCAFACKALTLSRASAAWTWWLNIGIAPGDGAAEPRHEHDLPPLCLAALKRG